MRDEDFLPHAGKRTYINTEEFPVYALISCDGGLGWV